ncbi:Arginyl-tRNA synthetase [Gamsiella multidivaricata]|nr:Arginyl-tRNA synthetase [Gamsiella multidivaricata]
MSRRHSGQESSLLGFRKAIASHLSSVLDQSSETLLPLVQQNTSHRKGSHSVFSVAIKRLCGGSDLDESIREKCLELSLPEVKELIARVRLTKDMMLFDPVPLRVLQITTERIVEDAGGGQQGGELKERESMEVLGKREREVKKKVVIVNGARVQTDESAYSGLRRTVLTGFVARVLESTSQSVVKVIAEETYEDIDPRIKTLYHGLDILKDHLIAPTATAPEAQTHLNTIKNAVQNNQEIRAQVKDSAWLVDLTSQQLGQAKLFTASTDGSMDKPTPLVQTLMSLARHFVEHPCDRYIWMVPDGRRQFAEQVLYLANIIFPGEGQKEDEEEEPLRKKRISGASGGCWAQDIEVLYFGAATGFDIWNSSSSSSSSKVSTGSSEIVEYTNQRMREIVTKNRGNPGRGTGYSEMDDDEDNDGGEKELVLNEEELKRMAGILSTSALAVASVGCKRMRKLTVDMNRILDGKGNSGVFLQIERKSKTRLNPDADLSLVQAYPEALNLSIVLAEWHDTLSALQETLDPYALVPYLFHLAAEVGQANHVLRVKDMDTAVAEARWLLFWCAKQVLEEGLRLLGLELVERM